MMDQPIYSLPQYTTTYELRKIDNIPDGELADTIQYCKNKLSKANNAHEDVKAHWEFISKQTVKSLRKELKKKLQAELFNKIEYKRRTIARLLQEKEDLQGEIAQLEKELTECKV